MQDGIRASFLERASGGRRGLDRPDAADDRGCALDVVELSLGRRYDEDHRGTVSL